MYYVRYLISPPADCRRHNNNKHLDIIMANAMLNSPPASAGQTTTSTPPHWDSILSASQRNNVRGMHKNESLFSSREGGREGNCAETTPFVRSCFFLVRTPCCTSNTNIVVIIWNSFCDSFLFFCSFALVRYIYFSKVQEVLRLINEEGVPPSHGNVVGQTAVSTTYRALSHRRRHLSVLT